MEQGDWETAIDQLNDMTEAKLYPTARNLNRWSETAHRRERGNSGGKKVYWRKERERVLVEGTLQSGAGVVGGMNGNVVGRTEYRYENDSTEVEEEEGK